MLEINDEEKQCYINNNPISLSKTEYSLLNFFLNNTNKVFSREDLISLIWKKEVSIRVVDVAISRLRKKIGKYGENLVCKSGFGYIYYEKL